MQQFLKGLFSPRFLIVLGILAIGLFVWPTLYIYGRMENSSEVFRVSRLGGTKEWASEFGWQTEAELQRRHRQKSEREKAEFERQVAGFLQEAAQGKVASAEWTGGRLTVIYRDGRSAEATISIFHQPIIERVTRDFVSRGVNMDGSGPT
jgi:hypothetical protein